LQISTLTFSREKVRIWLRLPGFRRRPQTALPRQLPGQRIELQLGQEPDYRLSIRFARDQRARIQRHRNIALDGDQLSRQARIVRLRQQGFTWALRRYVCRSRQDGVEISVFGEQLLGALFSDSLHSRDVVRCVPHQGEEVHHLPGLYPETFRRVAFIDPGLVHCGRAAPAGVEQGHTWCYQLIEILVS
jgi:hypothetical protein